MAHVVRMKRAYEAPEAGDGYRVLVERLWPRGVRKEALKLDAWSKDVAPSDALRRWYGHDPDRWEEFSRRYGAELREQPAADAFRELAARARQETVTLVYAARDEEHSGALVLQRALGRRGAPRTAARAPSKAPPKRTARRSRRST
jgi:uncharacterized protein YeaO (DUF488 family)